MQLNTLMTYFTFIHSGIVNPAKPLLTKDNQKFEQLIDDQPEELEENNKFFSDLELIKKLAGIQK